MHFHEPEMLYLQVKPLSQRDHQAETT